MTPPALLEDIRRAALAQGAQDAVVLAVDELIIDPRVRFKCLVPTCYLAGGSAHCPPNGTSSATSVYRSGWLLATVRGELVGFVQAGSSRQVRGTI